jgi:hypothetical protein
MLYRVDPRGTILWEKPLGFDMLIVNEWSADRNLTEDAFYMLALGAANKQGGLDRLLKYDRGGGLVFDLPIGPRLTSVSANPVFGGAYVADDESGVYRVDGTGHVLWGPVDVDVAHPGNGRHERMVSTDPWTGGVYASFHVDDGPSVIAKFSPLGKELWRRTVERSSRPIANPFDGGVYVATAEAGVEGVNTARFNAAGDMLWQRGHVAGAPMMARGLNTFEGCIIVAGGGRMQCVSLSGTEHWSMPNDDGYGRCFGDMGIVSDPLADVFYTAEGELEHGISRFDGATLQRTWHLDPGHEAQAFRLFLGVPATVNRLPDTRLAFADMKKVMPANHEFEALQIAGVSDADGDQLNITITAITQDEPVMSPGVDWTRPDAMILDGQASVRRERNGNGDGRVYQIAYTVNDGKGGSGGGVVNVCIPHDVIGYGACHDDGALYNSLVGWTKPIIGLAPVQIQTLRSSGTTMRVEFAIADEGDVEVALFDLSGRRVATPSRTFVQAGMHRIEWSTDGLPAGLYFCRVRSGSETATRSLFISR